MVRYYGRAKTRVGSVNTNQLGLKMSGCPSKVGKQGALVKYQSRRVQCNQKFCGPVYYQGQMWNWNQTNCVTAAPKNQSLAGGVGNINTPRFKCNSKCFSNGSILKQLDNALQIIDNYLSQSGLFNRVKLVLFGVNESLKKDKVLGKYARNIQFLSDLDIDTPNSFKNAVSLLDNLQYRGMVNGVYMSHKLAIITNSEFWEIYPKYGKPLEFGNYAIYAMENNVKSSKQIKFSNNPAPGGGELSIYEAVALFIWFNGSYVPHSSSDPQSNPLLDLWVKINTHISYWDVTAVTDLSYIFSGLGPDDKIWKPYQQGKIKNTDIQAYIKSPNTNWNAAISNALNLDAQPLNGWNTSKVQNMEGLLYYNGNITSLGIRFWNLTSVTNLYQIFYYATQFNENLYCWINYPNVREASTWGGVQQGAAFFEAVTMINNYPQIDTNTLPLTTSAWQSAFGTNRAASADDPPLPCKS